MTMKKTLYIIIVIYAIVLLGACAPKKPAEIAPVKETETMIRTKISPEDAVKLLAADDAPVLVDVREPFEFDGGHIRNALNIPLGNLVKGLEEKGIAKDTAVMVYCRSGSRSTNAAGLLQAAGFTKIYDLGGIINWPYEVVKE